jgi:D-tyrosyl-tRNA(Tyr) deacylase
MRAVVQRVSSASVTIAGATTGTIARGLLVFLGVARDDTEIEARWLAEKIVALRIFEDDNGRMNRSVLDLDGGILVISQFTLIASTRKGSRPSFNDAAKPDLAVPLYESFLLHASAALGRPVASGMFGAMMQVALVNEGPVTLVIDSRKAE